VADTELAELAGPRAGEATGPDDSLANRARAWYLEATRSSFWKTYTPKANENRGYYVGGKGQWSYEGSFADWDLLEKDGRARVSIDHIGPAVDILTGFEEQNRFDLKAEPVGNEDADDAEILSWLLKHASDQAEVQEHRSDGFEDTVIEGMTCYKLWIDYDEDIRGKIRVGRRRPGTQVLWDPHWEEYDLSDARYILEWAWVWVEDVIAEHPEHATRIKEAVGKLTATLRELGTGSSTDGGDSAYGLTGSHTVEDLEAERQFYDPDAGRVLVLEVWYRDYEPYWVVTDTDTGKIDPFDTGEQAKQFAASDPTRLTAVRRLRRIVRTGTVLPATLQTLEDGETPHTKDPTNYPYVLELGKRKGDDILGVVDKLKDPQRVENKRISQALDLAAKWLKIRLVYAEGSLSPAGESSLSDPDATNPLAIRPGFDKPGFLVPQGLSEATSILTNLAQIMETATRESSGVNAELQGTSERGSGGQSGIAIARRQAQGQVMNTRFFNNHRRTGKILGQRLARLIQQVYSYDDVIRLKDDLGQTHLVQMNPTGMKNLSPEERQKKRAEYAAKGLKVLADVDALKYDLVIAETPATSSARQAQLQALLEVLEKFPDVFPDVVDIVFELLNIPRRGEIIGRIRARMAAMQAAAQGMPPGAPPGAAPDPMLAGGPPGAPAPPPMPPPAFEAAGAPVAA
jgi:hypothetical protein